MGVDDLSPSASRLLSRRPPEELQQLQERAVVVLEQLDAAGELLPVASWTNERGEVIASWEGDDTLACYMDMLGLNGRAIVEYSSAAKAYDRAKRRQLARAAHD